MQVLSSITLAYTVEKSHRRRRLRHFVAGGELSTGYPQVIIGIKKAPISRGFFNGRRLGGSNYPIVGGCSVTVFFYVEINTTQVASFSNKFSLIFGTRIEFSFNYLTVRFSKFNSMFFHFFLSFLSHLYRNTKQKSSFLFL